MAKIGAALPMWAPIADEPKDALPKYGAEQIEIGTLVAANTSVTFASGQDHGSNRLVEEVNDFVSATCAMENNDTTLTVESAIYGSTMDEQSKELGDGAEDSAPYGGLTYYQTIQRNGKKVYRGVFYPKAKAALGQDNAQTKAGSVSFQHTTTNLSLIHI